MLYFLLGWGEDKPQVVVGEVIKDGVEEEETKEGEEKVWGVEEVAMKGVVVEEEESMEDQG